MDNYVGDLNLSKYEDYVKIFDALSHPIRIKIIGVLAIERQYVSELARIVNVSRPLLYMHLKKLEEARIIKGSMEISESGKATKYFMLERIDIRITSELLENISQRIVIEGESKWWGIQTYYLSDKTVMR